MVYNRILRCVYLVVIDGFIYLLFIELLLYYIIESFYWFLVGLCIIVWFF